MAAQLPLEVLERIAEHLPFLDRRYILPRVCKHWSEVLSQPSSVWRCCVVDRTWDKEDFFQGDPPPPERPTSWKAVLRWFAKRAAAVQELELIKIRPEYPTDDDENDWEEVRDPYEQERADREEEREEAYEMRRYLAGKGRSEVEIDLWFEYNGTTYHSDDDSLPPPPSPKPRIREEVDEHDRCFLKGCISELLTLLPGGLRVLTIDDCDSFTAGCMDSVAALTNLQKLEMLDCLHLEPLTALSALAQLEELRVQSLHHPPVPVSTEFLAALATLPKLNSLKLRLRDSFENELVPRLDLPAEAGRLRGLTQLQICGAVSHACVELTALTALRDLDLSCNAFLGFETPVTDFGEWEAWQVDRSLPLGLSEMAAVTSLNLSKCILIRLPSCLKAMPALLSLDLSLNVNLALCAEHHSTGWENLPAGLQLLSLEGCKLDALPQAMVDLRSLKSLNIAKNEVSELPSGPYLWGLTFLDLSHNPIEHYPAATMRSAVQLVRLVAKGVEFV